YLRWTLGMERNLLKQGLVERDELAAGRALHPGKPVKRVLTKDVVDRVFARGAFGRPTNTAARFNPGDRVRARNLNPPTHTRLPGRALPAPCRAFRATTTGRCSAHRGKPRRSR